MFVGLNRGPDPCLEAGSHYCLCGFPPAAVVASHHPNTCSSGQHESLNCPSVQMCCLLNFFFFLKKSSCCSLNACWVGLTDPHDLKWEQAVTGKLCKSEKNIIIWKETADRRMLNKDFCHKCYKSRLWFSCFNLKNTLVLDIYVVLA